ncbi:hypothetical protein C4J81_00625 [Deltaproteobacteria bacterium Smac51]|nr:hypothetical protein C4J81_00625 [Deltaproteobacteria bacterium Smac51]
MDNKRRIELRVNGTMRQLEVEPNTTLLEVLRDEMRLTGTKRGCDQGHCGACTVLLNGAPVNACLVLAPMADGKDVETIEGLESSGGMSAIQSALVEEGAVQCGFCTPGMVLSAKALLAEKPEPSRLEILEALSGNLCRCTGYERIVAGVQKAAGLLKGRGGRHD